MTDKKFTDEEIIKANDILDKLDFFNQRAGRELWNEKPVEVQDTDIRNREEDIKFLKDLINRQKAEIEKLNIQLQGLWNMASLYKAESERWEGYNENLLTANSVLSNEILEAKAKAKAEAYKEFAEKAKETFLNLQYKAKTDRKTVKIEELKEQMDWLLHTVAIETVDNLLKEMVGEE